MKIKITISLIWTVIVLCAFYFGRLARDYPVERQITVQQAYIAELENRTVTEQMKAIQRQVGCKKIDGEIGTETMPLVNTQVRAEKKRELMNQYAVESFERMAGDTK